MANIDNNDTVLLSVKDVCNRYGITRKTLFYYDKAGLISPARRVGTQSHKVYDSSEIEKLELILKYRNAGLTIEEIREMMNLGKNASDYREILERARMRLLNEKSKKEEELSNLEILIAEYESGIQQ